MLEVKKRSLTLGLVSALVMWLGATAQAASEPWREAALVATEHFATTVEVLDEALTDRKH